VKTGVVGAYYPPEQTKDEQTQKGVARKDMKKQEPVIIINEPRHSKGNDKQPVKYSCWQIPYQRFFHIIPCASFQQTYSFII